MVVIYKIKNPEYRDKMAALDYDWTLVNPQNGKTAEPSAPAQPASNQDSSTSDIPNSSNNVKSALEQFDNLFSKG